MHSVTIAHGCLLTSVPTSPMIIHRDSEVLDCFGISMRAESRRSLSAYRARWISDRPSKIIFFEAIETVQ